jgi:hypothetical protein
VLRRLVLATPGLPRLARRLGDQQPDGLEFLEESTAAGTDIGFGCASLPD